MVLAVAYGAMTFQRLRESVYLTVRTTAMGLLAFRRLLRVFFGLFLSRRRAPDRGVRRRAQSDAAAVPASGAADHLPARLAGWSGRRSSSSSVPIFLPLLPQSGIDPLFFGILVALNLQTSFLTPPMAMSAYYLKGDRAAAGCS